MPPPDRALVEEVRVAMALNGGVSLAVWMGGCAVELDCARRAHLHPEHIAPEDGVAPPPRSVYHAVCAAFRRELVLDLMSGSSAGGINGALLATAIVHNRRLHPRFIRDKWLELGDFGELLHDTSVAAPRSLMDGTYFKRGLEGAFAALVAPTHPQDRDLLVLDEADSAQLAGRQVALEVTATDVDGRRRTFRDHWGEDLVAHEYRGRFSFRTRDDYSVERLATAARSSASFPVAFEPSAVPAGMLARFPGRRWTIDGGVLDNAPIKAVLELIPSRPADRQVRRFVCYVNADPPFASADDRDGGGTMPTLEAVLEYALNLPRKATFVDHLDAVERATGSGPLAGEAEASLLKLGLAPLRETAGELLQAYRNRRRLLSIRELVTEPGGVEPVYARLRDGRELPWIPVTLGPPERGSWGWGARAAQRVVHLLIDLVRHAAADAPPEPRTRLFALRRTLDERLEALEAAHRAIAGDAGVRGIVQRLAGDRDVDAELAALAALMRDPERDPAIRSAVEQAAADVLAESDLIAALTDAAYLRGLFGEEWQPAAAAEPLSEAQLEAFLARTLAVEVVRRAFAADEDFQTAQRLAFAQLTPCAPALLFSPRAWATAWDKLTGVKWGHFAAFYRASWRANDFMWGRLDAAVRIMDLLVDPDRARQVVADGGRPPWKVLAAALVPDGATEAQRLAVAEPIGEEPGAPDLRARLAAALQEDLGASGALTRTVCARAAQLEVLQHELPLVVERSRRDVAVGTSAPPIDLDLSRPWPELIAAIRTGQTFPQRLGRELEGEAASALAMRTSTRAVFVALAALRATRRPFTRALYTLRTPLLPVAGLVSRTPHQRAAVVLVYWATAVLVAARLATTERGSPPLDDVWALPVLATFLAVVGVLAIAAVPGWRAARAGDDGVRRWAQLGWLAVLLGAGGAVGVACALASALTADAILVQHGAEAPPDAVLAAAVAVTLGLPLALPVPGVRGLVDKVLRRRGGDRAALVGMLGPWAVVGGFAAVDAAGVLDDLDGWRSVTAGLGLIGAPLALLAYLFASRIRRLRAGGPAPAAAPAPRPKLSLGDSARRSPAARRG